MGLRVKPSVQMRHRKETHPLGFSLGPGRSLFFCVFFGRKTWLPPEVIQSESWQGKEGGVFDCNFEDPMPGIWCGQVAPSFSNQTAFSFSLQEQGPLQGVKGATKTEFQGCQGKY